MELASEKKDNYNIIKLHDWSHNGSNLIGTISYHNLSRDGPLINHLSPDLPNFLGQPSKLTFELTYTINFFIKLVAPLAYDHPLIEA